jgi:hypothetical protein
MREESVLDFLKSALMAEIHLCPFEIKFPTPTKSTRHSPTLQEKFTIEGYLEHGDTTMFSVKGKDIVLSDETWTFGTLEVGNYVKVRGIYLDNDEALCISILTTPPPLT